MEAAAEGGNGQASISSGEMSSSTSASMSFPSSPSSSSAAAAAVGGSKKSTPSPLSSTSASTSASSRWCGVTLTPPARWYVFPLVRTKTPRPHRLVNAARSVARRSSESAPDERTPSAARSASFNSWRHIGTQAGGNTRNTAASSGSPDSASPSSCGSDDAAGAGNGRSCAAEGPRGSQARRDSSCGCVASPRASPVPPGAAGAAAKTGEAVSSSTAAFRAG